ncbi:putative hydrophobin precursor [Xylariales sp. PMI_506]|nr:putative hydrophobin precursor [Xylariales sp. PMI_506]
MKGSIAFAAIFAGIASAMPTELDTRQNAVCTGVFGVAQCCGTFVSDVAGLGCDTPTNDLRPTNSLEFVNVCAAVGKSAGCCVLPVAGQDLLCQPVII